MINTRLKVCYAIPLIMGSLISTRQTNSQPLINTLTKVKNPKPIRVQPNFSLGECIFTVDNPELYRDHSCKVIFKYVVNDEVCKEIRGKVIKDILTGLSNYTQWYLRTYIPVEEEDKNNWYVFKTTLDEETIAIYKLNDFSYHIC